MTVVTVSLHQCGRKKIRALGTRYITMHTVQITWYIMWPQEGMRLRLDQLIWPGGVGRSRCGRMGVCYVAMAIPWWAAMVLTFSSISPATLSRSAWKKNQINETNLEGLVFSSKQFIKVFTYIHFYHNSKYRTSPSPITGQSLKG